MDGVTSWWRPRCWRPAFIVRRGIFGGSGEMAEEQSPKAEKPPEGTLGGYGEKAGEPSRTPAEPPEAAELRVLVQQAQKGDTSTLPRIRQILDDHSEVWHHVGNLGLLVERAWLSLLTGDNPV